MSDVSNDALVWAAKGAGAVAGSAISLAYMLGTAETMLMGSAAASLCAWWAVGAVIRVLERWRLKT